MKLAQNLDAISSKCIFFGLSFSLALGCSAGTDPKGLADGSDGGADATAGPSPDGSFADAPPPLNRDSESESPDGAPRGDGSVPDAAPPTCVSSGVAASSRAWALPPGYGNGAFDSIAGSLTGCSASASPPAFSTFDIDGDAKPDLVVTATCSDTAVGTSSWVVYKNLGTGFAQVPAMFALPPGYPSLSFPSTGEGAASCSTNFPGFSLLDVDGDGKPDLVVTTKCDDATVGSTSWVIYKNLGSGFAQVPTTFALPGGYASKAFDAIAQGTSACNASLPGFSTFDVDGDRRPDLVVTLKCDDATVGSSSWLVYKNLGSGFAPTATRFALPPGYASNAFDAVAEATSACGANLPAFSTLDVDGDGKPDLVITVKCDDAAVGTSSWLVYENLGTGFAQTATLFALPPGYAANAFDAVAEATSECGAKLPAFSMLDADGDRRPDLVITARCEVDDAGVGASSWLLYKNLGKGFAPAPTTFALPAGFPAASFIFTAEAAACANGYPAFSIMDADGNGKPDVMVTTKCDDPAIGTTSWLLYSAQCN